MEEKNEQVSYFVFEGAMARMERTNHRQWIIIIILIAALILTNLAWIIYESQYIYEEEITQEVTQDTRYGGVNNFVGGDYHVFQR